MSVLLRDRVQGNHLLINGSNAAGLTWRHLAQLRPDNAGFAAVTIVNAIGCEAVRDSNVHVFTRFPLTALCLGNTAITNRGLRALEPLAPTLTELCLRGTTVTDEGLTVEWVQKFPNLGRLVVPAGVSDTRIEELKDACADLEITR